MGLKIMNLDKYLTVLFLFLLLFSSMYPLTAQAPKDRGNDGGNEYEKSSSSVDSSPAPPSSPEPYDGKTSVPLNVSLSVNVSDPDGDTLNVTFYNASGQTPIGEDKNVTNGSRAHVPWSGLELNATYSWYAVADDGENTTQSSTWSFTTASVDSVKITQGANGSELLGGEVPKNYIEWGNCSAYNDTAGYITTVESFWTAEGGNSSLLNIVNADYNGIDVGNQSGDVWFNCTYNSSYNDSVHYKVINTSIDYINITDGPNGTALTNEVVPVDNETRGYLSAYNDTEGYLCTIKGNWSAEGGTAYLTEPVTNESNVINVGTSAEDVWLNLSYDEFNDSVRFEVNAPSVDHIDITDTPGGDPVGGGSVPVGHVQWGNCSAYNNSIGYIHTVIANWSAQGDPGTDPYIGPTPSNVSWIDVGNHSGTVTWNASYSTNSTDYKDSVMFKVSSPTVDHIDITDSPGGTPLSDQSVPVGKNITGYCSAYNSTSGYIQTVEANWSADGGNSYISGSGSGNSSSIVVGNESGTVWFNASYDGSNDSVELNVTEAAVDHIEITDRPGDGYDNISDRSIYVEREITGYAAGFNESAGYIGDKNVTWTVVNSEGADSWTDPSAGTNSTFHSGDQEGTCIWKAEYSAGINDSVTFDVMAPEIDDIRIRTLPNGGGEVVRNMTYEINESDRFYAAGYNRSYGFIRDLTVDWVSDNPSVGDVHPERGKSTNLSAEGLGDGNVFAVYDGLENSTGFEVIPVQSPEIVGDIPDLELEEDFGVYHLDLSDNASDRQDSESEMRWFLTDVNTTIVSTAGENQTGNHIISFISQSDEYGRMNVRYWLVDSDGNTDDQTGWINVSSVNDAPEIKPLPDLYVHYDEEYKFDYYPYITDIDDPLSNISLSTDDPGHTTVNGLNVTYNYPESMVGDDIFVRLSVSDGEKSAHRVIKVTVTDNYPPVNNKKVPDVTLKEGELRRNVFNHSLDYYITDPDKDSLYMSYGYTHLNITIYESNHTVDMHADSEWSGREKVTFRAEDPTGAIVEQTINVTVISVNDPPELEELPPFVVHYDYPYTFDLKWYISDSDDSMDELKISTSSPEYVTVDGTELTFLYPKTLDTLTYPYRVELVVSVSDGIDSTHRRTTVKVSDNYPPELFVPLHDISFNEDEKLRNAFDLDNHFKDRDNETIYYTSGNRSIKIEIHENHSVDFWAEEDWYGKELITVRGTDPAGALMEDSIYVSVLPVNDPPVIEDIPVQEGEAGESWILDLNDYISDIDDDKSELTISAGDPQVEVARHKLIFTYDKKGEYSVELSVSDGEYNITQEIEVEVSESSSKTGIGTPGWILISLITLGLIGSAVYLVKRHRYTIDDVFLIHKSGVLIKHTTRTLKAERDEDILAGMLTAVENFVDDAFSEEEEEGLKRMDYGDKTVLVHRGEHITLAAFFSGEEPRWAFDSMRNFVSDIEERYEGDIEDWKGDKEDLPGITDMMEDFVRFSSKYHKGDWKD